MSTPNMGLTLPTVSQTPGPQWASEINSDLSLLDSHDHTTGKGMQVPVAGLNIDDDLPLGGLYGVEQASFLGLWPQLSAPAGATKFYSDASGNLFYKNGSGVPVQITTGTSVVPGVSGGITGLVSPASVSYDVGSETFKFYRDTGANAFGTVEHGPLVLHTATAGAPGLQIQPSASMVTGYTLTLPPTLPASTASFQSVDTSGVMANVAPDNSTIEISSTVLQVKALGVDSAQIAPTSVTQAKLAAANYNVTAVNTSLLTYNNVTTPTAITQLGSLVVNVIGTVGRPLMCVLISSGVPSYALIGGSRFTGTHPFVLYYQITGPSGSFDVGHVQFDANKQYSPSTMLFYYEPPILGVYSVSLYAKNTPVNATTDLEFVSMRLFAQQV